MSTSATQPDEGEHTTYADSRLDDRNLKATLAQVLDRWPCAGLAVAVITDESLAWFHGHGLADVVAKTPITKDTVFRIASLTKTFTAVAVMQLWEQGLVDLDAPANDYLRTFRLISAKPNLSPATVRHLLTHTAGVGYWRRLLDLLQPGVGSGDRARRSGAQSLADYYRRGLPVEVEPGTKWAYSNHGFAALGQIVEAVSGQPLDRYLQDRIFDPLGMEHTDLLRSERGPTPPGHRLCVARRRPQAGQRPRGPDRGRGWDVLDDCRYRSLRRRPAEDRRQRAGLSAEA